MSEATAPMESHEEQAPPIDKGKGKAKATDEHGDNEATATEEEAAEEDEDEEMEEDDEPVEEDFSAIDPSVILPAGSRRRGAARIDYSSHEAHEKAGLVNKPEAEDDEEEFKTTDMEE